MIDKEIRGLRPRSKIFFIVGLFVLIMVTILRVTIAYAFNDNAPYYSPISHIQQRYIDLDRSGEIKWAVLQVQRQSNPLPSYVYLAITSPGNLYVDKMLYNGEMYGIGLRTDSDQDTVPPPNILIAAGESYPNQGNWNHGYTGNPGIGHITDRVTGWFVKYANTDIPLLNGGVETGQMAYIADTSNYSYQYDPTIENVHGVEIERAYKFKLGPVYIGMSDTEHNMMWNAPENEMLMMEIDISAEFDQMTRRYRAQKYNSPFYTGTILPGAELLNFDTNVLGKQIVRAQFKDRNPSSLQMAIVKVFYLRYVRIDGVDFKIKYGNWTKIAVAMTGQGIRGVVLDNVTTPETTNEDGTIDYGEDVPIEGNETVYQNYMGDEVNEEDMYTAFEKGLETNLYTATQAIKNVGEWFGQVPVLVSSVFSFLPGEIITFLGLVIVVLMVLKIVNR